MQNQQQNSQNYYDIGQFNMSNKSDAKSKTRQRGLDQVPRELRTSKQSFQQAMEKPCNEFFVDVM